MISFIKAMLQKKAIRYLIAGGTATVIDYLVFTVLVKGFGMAETVVIGQLCLPNIIAMTVGMVISFFINKYWSFGSTRRGPLQFVMTVVLFLVNLTYSSAFITYAREDWGMDPLVAKLIITVVVMMVNFLLFNKLIFRMSKPKNTDIEEA